MVTKPLIHQYVRRYGSVLAKIHMVTKLHKAESSCCFCSVLAKIHMVTKRYMPPTIYTQSSVLAKIHMVTKPAMMSFLS